MATSGVTTTELNRDSIISSAMRKIGALAKAQVPDAEDLSNSTTALNNLVAEFMTMGMPMWAKATYVVPLVASQATYTLTSPFPLRILQAWYSDSTGTFHRQLNETSDYNINFLPNGANGTPTQYSYQPKINFGVLTIWPAPDTAVVAGSLSIRYFAPFDTFSAAGDTPFFPREWNNALVYGLASLLAPEWGVPLNDRGMLQKEAALHLENALAAGSEQASMFVTPYNL